MANKILPINKDVDVRAYTHEAYINTIINNSFTTGESLARINVENYNDYYWDTVTSHLVVNNDACSIEFCEKKYDYDMHAISYRSCCEIDELIVKVEYQQMLRTWGSIGIFIKDKEDILDFSKQAFPNIYGGQRFCNGYFKSFQDPMKFEVLPLHTHYSRIECPYYLKLTYTENNIAFSVSTDTVTWTCIESTPVISDHTKKSIGFYINAGENQYYNWLYTNYIQLRCDKELQLPLEYIGCPIKNWKFYTLNPFINFSVARKRDLVHSGESIIAFIKSAIESNKYLEFTLDEIYFPTTLAYINNMHYLHQVLVYGYNEEEACLYISGYKNGLLVTYTVSYDNFTAAYLDKTTQDSIYVLEYILESKEFNFNLKMVCMSIYEYLHGIDSTMHFGGIVPVQENVAGIRIYNELLTNPYSFSLLLNDIRISYIICEHKKIMVDRINFMLARDIVSYEEVENIQLTLNELYELSSLLNKNIIKNLYNKKQNIEELIRNYIEKIKVLDESVMESLYQLLSKKCL